MESLFIQFQIIYPGFVVQGHIYSSINKLHFLKIYIYF